MSQSFVGHPVFLRNLFVEDKEAFTMQQIKVVS